MSATKRILWVAILDDRPRDMTVFPFAFFVVSGVDVKWAVEPEDVLLFGREFFNEFRREAVLKVKAMVLGR